MTTLKAILNAIGSFFAFFLPVVKSKAELVAPEIQREINKILAEAKAKADSLKANHSVASIQKQMDDDIKAVRETAEHHVSLIQQLAKSKIAEAGKLLPDVASFLPPEPATPPEAPTPAS